MRVRVYIAGPYTLGHVGKNVHKAMEMWHTLKDLGYSPLCPHLTHFLGIHKFRPIDEWYEYDLDWLEVCHILLRMPGESMGSDREVEIAKELNIPVVYTVSELLDVFPPDKLEEEDEWEEEEENVYDPESYEWIED